MSNKIPFAAICLLVAGVFLELVYQAQVVNSPATGYVIVDYLTSPGIDLDTFGQAFLFVGLRPASAACFGAAMGLFARRARRLDIAGAAINPLPALMFALLAVGVPVLVSVLFPGSRALLVNSAAVKAFLYIGACAGCCTLLAMGRKKTAA